MRSQLFAVSFSLVFACAASAQSTIRVSVRPDGVEGNGAGDVAMSSDGRYVLFSGGDEFVTGDENQQQDLVLHDNWTGINELISLTDAGLPSNGSSGSSFVSGNGRFVAFVSDATNLVASDTNHTDDVFLRDRQAGTLVRASLSNTGAQVNQGCFTPSVSDDGRFVVFDSPASGLVPGDTNGKQDIFLRDLQTSTTTRVNVSSTGVQGTMHTNGGKISADGRFVVFSSTSSNLVPGDTNGFEDIFVRDIQAATTTRVNLGPGGVQGNNHSFIPRISADGRFIAFVSSATNLGPINDPSIADGMLLDRQTGQIQSIDVGFDGRDSNGVSNNFVVSADGLHVAFVSSGTNLVAGDTNIAPDVFVRDVVAQTTSRVNVSSSGAQAINGGVGTAPALSSDGRYTAFEDYAPNLVAGGTPHHNNAFLHDSLSACPPVIAYCTAKPNSLGCTPRISSAGEPLLSLKDAFYLTAINVLSQKNGIFLWGTTSASIPFGGGTLCVHSPIVRTPVQNSGSTTTLANCTGSYSFHFTQAYMGAHGLTAGQAVYGQCWSRDPGFAPPNNIGLTDALFFTIAP